MHVVVVGCGRVGSRLATQLSDEGHSVAVVDRREASFTKLPERFTGITVVGVGFDRDRLRAARIEEADAVAAVTSGDNSNVLVARVARDAFGVEQVVARIYDPRRAEIYERLGIPTVATVQWTTDRVLRRVGARADAVEWTDPTAGVQMVERTLSGRWAAHVLGDLEAEAGVRAVAFSRNGVSALADSAQIIQDGDVVWFALAGTDQDRLDTALAASNDAGGHH